MALGPRDALSLGNINFVQQKVWSRWSLYREVILQGRRLIPNLVQPAIVGHRWKHPTGDPSQRLSSLPKQIWGPHSLFYVVESSQKLKISIIQQRSIFRQNRSRGVKGGSMGSVWASILNLWKRYTFGGPSINGIWDQGGGSAQSRQSKAFIQ